jgi:dTDP-4-dehydrorhamnose 3,5-epimerase
MSDRFQITQLPIEGLQLLERLPIGDARGFLERLFCTDTFQALGFPQPIAQINRTLTRKCGTVRGMHYQKPPHAEVKVINCLRGEVFDVAIDLRAESPTFLRWHGEVLSQDNHKTLVIPEGFAHGFQTLTQDCEMLYFHTANYSAEAEGGVWPLDSRVNITWPLAIEELSARDAAHPPLMDNYEGIVL